MSIPSDLPSGHGRPIDAAKARLSRQLRLELELAGIAPKAVAYGCGTDPAQLCRWLHDGYPDQFPAWLVPLWTREVGPGLMGWLCGQVGGEFTHAAPHAGAEGSFQDLTALLSQRAGHSVSQLVQALADSQVTEDELDTLRPDLLRLKAVIDGLVERAGA